MLENKIAQFAPVEVKYDSTLLNDKQKLIIEKLYKASKVIDTLYLEQMYPQNLEILRKLSSAKDEEDKLKYEYFKIMGEPFDRLDNNKPFMDSETFSKGANFYPKNMTEEEFNSWIKDHPNDEASFTSSVTVIRRHDDGLISIPYSEFYQPQLKELSDLLNEAANYAENQSLKKYLELRAKAFETNDYFQSNMAWMDLKDNLIEVVIGPYEVYEDGLFNYKSAFESFVTIKDPEESAKLEKFSKYLKDIEEHLPIEERYKNTKRGSESPIVVVNEVYAGGEAHFGVQTLAFNLPNDEKVRTAKGSKKVMIKNLHEAKFEKLLLPIADTVLAKNQLRYVTFNAFFGHTLMHEISHGVGPGYITANEEKTTVQKALRDTYSTLEECKADVLGIYNNIFMIEKGLYPKDYAKQFYVSFLAGIFRSVRFGINEAHGGGNAIIYNYLLEKGGYEYNEETQKVRVNFNKIYPALKELAHKILAIQAAGNYNKAKQFIKKYAAISPSMETLRSKLSHLPVDIKPVYQIDKELKK
jgi:Peptidase family M49